MEIKKRVYTNQHKKYQINFENRIGNKAKTNFPTQRFIGGRCVVLLVLFSSVEPDPC